MFAVVFAIVWLLSHLWWFAAIIATLVSAALSILFLDKSRTKAAEGFASWRGKDRTEDDVVEDEMIDQDPTLLKRDENES